MHVCFGALDVIVQIVAEELDVGDRGVGNVRFVKVPWEEDESNVADVFRT